jgi:ABC-2 type transport system permease protein
LKVLATIHKEYLLLVRDPGGMALIFLMPLVMLIVMALVQDAPFRDYQESKLDVLLVDNDHDSLAFSIRKAFQTAPNLHLVSYEDSVSAKSEVAGGRYKAAIILAPGTSASLRLEINYLMKNILANAGLQPVLPDSRSIRQARIQIYFDPAIKVNYRQALASSLEKMIADVQSAWMLTELQSQLAPNRPAGELKKVDLTDLVKVHQQYASQRRNSTELMSSVQHNVPAWAMFAMFLILFPLAGNFIKERQEGSMLRLQLIAGSQMPALVGKFTFYFLVCLFQFLLMMAAGIFLMPLFDLGPLVLGHNLFGTLLAACSVALAATGYGMLIAVYFKTEQQALSFGSTSVIILAALGGVWVPTYVMPEFLQQISRLSPLNWGLESFTNLFLRGASTMTILPEVMKLVGFALITLAVSVWIYRSRTIS